MKVIDITKAIDHGEVRVVEGQSVRSYDRHGEFRYPASTKTTFGMVEYNEHVACGQWFKTKAAAQRELEARFQKRMNELEEERRKLFENARKVAKQMASLKL